MNAPATSAAIAPAGRILLSALTPSRTHIQELRRARFDKKALAELAESIKGLDVLQVLRDQCAAANVPFFFKQWGAWLPRTNYYGDDRNEQWIDRAGYGHGVQLLTQHAHEWVVGDPLKGGRHDGQPPPGTWVVQRLDKKAAGRQLDGRTHDEYPAVQPTHEVNA